MLSRLDFIEMAIDKEVARLEFKNAGKSSLEEWPENEKNLWFSLTYIKELILPVFDKYQTMIVVDSSDFQDRQANVETNIEKKMKMPC